MNFSSTRLMRHIRLHSALAVLLCAVLLCLPVSAGRGATVHTPQTPYSWYCRHMHSHEPPALDAPLRFTENYNCYYLDRAADPSAPVLYLTFDLGYENGNTEKILDILDRNGVRAAFFVLEHVVTANTDLVRRMAESGHLVCNHTAKHGDMSRADHDAFLAELNALENVYRDTLGFELAPFYRPPEGKFTEENLQWAQEAGYSTVFWSFAYADWDNKNQPDPQKAIAKIIENTHNGEILLLHPTSDTNAAILETLLQKWTEMGYRFGTLNELGGRN